MRKNGKKIVEENHNNFSISYGTVDNTSNKSVYIDISSWLELLSDEEPKVLTSLLKKTIKNVIYGQLNGVPNRNKRIYPPNTPFLSSYIVDLDLRESGMVVGKKSFMSCDVTLYTNEELSNVTPHIQQLIESIVEAIEERFSDIFIFNRKKKT